MFALGVTTFLRKVVLDADGGEGEGEQVAVVHHRGPVHHLALPRQQKLLKGKQNLLPLALLRLDVTLVNIVLLVVGSNPMRGVFFSSFLSVSELLLRFGFVGTGWVRSDRMIECVRVDNLR